jgi:hypothetical protein
VLNKIGRGCRKFNTFLNDAIVVDTKQGTQVVLRNTASLCSSAGLLSKRERGVRSCAAGADQSSEAEQRSGVYTGKEQISESSGCDCVTVLRRSRVASRG